ncbi:neutral amino acid transporter 9-like [Oratosquilla oratoria]|uniref:neutral amino acid transporter 9-like n=1 Tax=Oratosquilla oratoria TaxID=337810 RepID=UPI003F771955
MASAPYFHLDDDDDDDSSGVEPEVRSDSELQRETTSVPQRGALSDDETRSLLKTRSAPNYGINPSTSWSNTFGPPPYTEKNKPKRKPFHYGSTGGTSVSRDGSESQLYQRYKYYSRLRAPVPAEEHALVLPDHIIPPEFFLPYLPAKFQGVDGKQASFVTIIAIWNTMMGTSLLTMPWAFGQAGFVGGLLIMISMAALCLYTSYRVLVLQKVMGLEGPPTEFGPLCRTLFPGIIGKVAEGLAVIFSVLTLVGALIVYWVLMSNFLYNTGEIIYQSIYGQADNHTEELLCPANETMTGVRLMDPQDTFHQWWQLKGTVPLYLILPFIFIINLKDATFFTYFNSLGAVSVIAMIIFVISRSVLWGFNYNLTDVDDPFYVPLFKSSFMVLIGTLSLAYFIHNCIITIMRGNRHQENNVRDLSIAYTLVSASYIPVGVLFYMSIPLAKYCIAQNFLDNFPPHNVILAICRGFLFFQMFTVFPLLTYFIRNQLFSYFFGAHYTLKMRWLLFLNGLLLAACISTAILYPNVGIIIRWVGAISGLAYIFILPCVTYMYALHTQQKLSWTTASVHTFLIILGLANFTSQFFISE